MIAAISGLTSSWSKHLPIRKNAAVKTNAKAVIKTKHFLKEDGLSVSL